MAGKKLTESALAQKLAEDMVNSLKNSTHIYDMNIIEYYLRKAILKGTRKKYRTKGTGHSTKKVPVVQLDSWDKPIGYFESYADAENLTGIKKESICMVCKGKRNVAGGYKWKYDENY